MKMVEQTAQLIRDTQPPNSLEIITNSDYEKFICKQDVSTLDDSKIQSVDLSTFPHEQNERRTLAVEID